MYKMFLNFLNNSFFGENSAKDEKISLIKTSKWLGITNWVLYSWSGGFEVEEDTKEEYQK